MKECFYEVKVIRGVGKGIITKEQAEILAIKYDLDDDEKEAFYTLLDDNNIHPVMEKDTGQIDEAKIKQTADSKKDAYEVIAEAVIDISVQRIKRKRKNGWVCGTYVNNMKKLLERRIYLSFSENEITELIDFCKSGNCGSKSVEHWETVLKELLFLAPSIRVNEWGIEKS